jgi:tripartite-type tricarboxylate transporter receptor subunit TctC
MGIAAMGVVHAQADPVAAFYQNKNLSVVIGIPPGGGYDLSARIFARHIGKHVAGNPGVVAQNMPGANSIVAANHVYNVAPQDGTVIWTGSRTTPFEPLFGNPNARFDPRKAQWICSLSSEIGVIFVWHTMPHRTFEDLYKHDVVVGATAAGAENMIFSTALNFLLNTKFKIVRGYRGQAPLLLAIERGELQGSGHSSWSGFSTERPDWIKEKKVRLLAQIAPERHRTLPDVPTVLEFAKDPDTRDVLSILLSIKRIGFPYFVGPNVPKERVDALRAACSAMMKDPEYRADILKLIDDPQPATGAEVQKSMVSAYSGSPHVVEKLRAAIAVK